MHLNILEYMEHYFIRKCPIIGYILFRDSINYWMNGLKSYERRKFKTLSG